ncbi:MAG TPA: RNA 2',3'-cyclic phosphodiesterase [Bryobacteraceae bacterium]|jgi:2'-5' RNA ligase|nr:RNA 2',3'-cyclic phosphodiesterase [Bryobacteraceae bacterium]
MRLFTGIDLPEDVRERLERLLMHLRPAAHLKWSPVYNLHVTLKFIGEWPEEKLPQLEAALRSIAPRAEIPVEVKSLGWFPNAHHPRVFWAGVLGGDALAALARDTDDVVSPLGIPKEDRAFTAHLTLARIKEAVPLQALRGAIEQLESVEFGNFLADRFYLFRSQPGPAGSIYTKLSEYPFRAK